VEPLDLHPEFGFELGVQVGHRLVEQEHVRVLDERAAQRDTLLLAAGEFGGHLLQLFGDLEGLGGLVDGGVALGLGDAGDFQPVGDVLPHGHVGVERDGLEHHRGVAVLWAHLGHVAVAEVDRARGGRLQPGDHPQRGGLPAARGADDGRERALGNLQREVVDGHVGRAGGVVLLANVVESYRSCHGYSRPPTLNPCSR
jgi:hypothetical protein